MPAPLPSNEAERLETLARYGVLDTPPDAALDRLTALAARLFDVPVALVTLIEKDRQWFKSHHGTDLCESPRDVSFCAYAILPAHQEVLVVPDATLDPRFADNPLVTGPLGVRFYAGAPLRTSDGTALGTLCLDRHAAARVFRPRNAPRCSTSPPPPLIPSNCTSPGGLPSRRPPSAAGSRRPCAAAKAACAAWPPARRA